MKIGPPYPTFSHPDFTVGFGIAPNQPEGSRTITAGRELHPALKINQYKFINTYMIQRFHNFDKNFTKFFLIFIQTTKREW